MSTSFRIDITRGPVNPHTDEVTYTFTFTGDVPETLRALVNKLSHLDAAGKHHHRNEVWREMRRELRRHGQHKAAAAIV
ncbi:hypothetical protein [Actinokineospora inagensis]|uniref:hypothetical protein n=1 Tax=Actinokineospora inagensis TaxID=103730 RepID=UPI00040ACD01|nr:hypothetical protein [Actinokineospora inagensis]